MTSPRLSLSSNAESASSQSNASSSLSGLRVVTCAGLIVSCSSNPCAHPSVALSADHDGRGGCAGSYARMRFPWYCSGCLWHQPSGRRCRGGMRAWRNSASTTVLEHLVEAEFCYESFQNWQSEFLSIAILVVLGIFLRQKGSPESKPVAAPHH